MSGPSPWPSLVPPISENGPSCAQARPQTSPVRSSPGLSVFPLMLSDVSTLPSLLPPQGQATLPLGCNMVRTSFLPACLHSSSFLSSYPAARRMMFFSRRCDHVTVQTEALVLLLHCFQGGDPSLSPLQSHSGLDCFALQCALCGHRAFAHTVPPLFLLSPRLS